MAPEFKAAIARVEDASTAKQRPPEVPAVTRAAERVVLGAGSEGFREDRDYDVIAHEIRAEVSRGAPLSRKMLADAVWCLWATKPALAETPSVLTRLIDTFADVGRSRLFRSLAASYLQNFRQDLPGLFEISALLQKTAPIAREPYRGLSAELDLFIPQRGPENIATQAIEMGTSIPEYFRKKGVGTQTAFGEYSSHATELALQRLESGRPLDAFEHLRSVKRLALHADGSLLFGGLRSGFANALLLPYESQDPGKSERDQYLELLLEVIGDPRSHSARWTPMPRARDVALRWFTEQSLRQFLDIVDKVADRRMWRYRRAFWEAVHAKGLIDSAWVVFDGSGAREARSRFGKNTKFGQFSLGVQSGQAALILQIGPSVVAEWSHNGRCHIWNDGSEGPAPYKSRYKPAELRATSSGNADCPRLFSQSHVSPDTYSWQRKVASKLQRITGISISQSEYKISRYD
ncbi:hypothetical protein FHS89_002193 [Rubricella aquisinus]|uniref:Zorya protein ZorC EH domain-containing protein n=1 Tax=Rubricella aquisinus TaxID=2028108 RepID=A0A840X629_9RHOB|nr:EH signature domain-containing protein [Rubricella aquisinus]MBB5516167.1 hypothetical protein [Rubricella aquisinus]